MSSLDDFNLYNSSADTLAINLGNIALGSSSKVIERVGNVKDVLHQQLQHFVSANCDDLLAQMTKLNECENHLHRIQGKVFSLMTCLDSLRSQLNQPYEHISHRILVLNRLHTTCDLLRRIIRFMHLCRQINGIDLKSSDQSREVIKAAQCVSELNDLISQDDNLLKVEIIKSDLIHLGDKQNDILEIANSCLNIGLEKQDINLIVISQHVYFYFDMLEEKVENYFAQAEETVVNSIRNVFDLQEYTQAKSSGPGGAIVLITQAQATTFREKFWNSFENVMEQMCNQVIKLDVLVKVLKKKRDPHNQSLMFDILKKSISVSASVSRIVEELNQTMSKASNSSNLMKEVLETDYQKLLRIFTNVWTRLARDERDLDVEVILRPILKPYEEAHKLRPTRQRWRPM